MAYILSKEIAASAEMEAIPAKMSVNWHKLNHSRQFDRPKHNIEFIAMYKGTVSSPTSKSATAKLIKRK